VQNTEANQYFTPHSQDPADHVCFDSGTFGPDWASVSHGIYLSIEAAGVHRSLGVRVSFVQSTSMDAWRPVHQRMMELGGNRRFEKFLLEHGVPRDAPIREKYLTQAAKWYREDLRARAEGSERPPPLPVGIGHLPAALCDLYPELSEARSCKVLRKRVTSGSSHAEVECRSQDDSDRHAEQTTSVRQARCWATCRMMTNLFGNVPV